MVQVVKAVAGVLLKDAQVLMVSRPKGKIFAGSWEFPGGKLEEGESAMTALARELEEEIGVEVSMPQCENLTFIRQDYSHYQGHFQYQVELDVILVNHWQGQVKPLEGQQIYWQDLTTPCYQNPLLITTQKILDLLVIKYKEFKGR